jgi:hypothetical protein
VPTRAAWEFKKCASLSFAAWDQFRTQATSAFPFPSRKCSRSLHLFMYPVILCVPTPICPSHQSAALDN